MKKTALVLALLAMTGLARAQSDKPAAAGDNPMAGWKPPKVTNEQKDRQEIQALLKQFEAAGKQGDLDAAVALLDFPVLMVTDDSKGQGMGEAWTKEKWVEQMRPLYKQPMPAGTNKPTITLLSDSLAIVTNQWSMPMGKQQVSGRSALQLVRVDGKWRIKSMTEGGWGDTMGTAAAASAGGASSTGTGSTGGSGSSTPSGSMGGKDSSTGTGTSGGAGSTGSMGTSPTAPGSTGGTGSTTGAGTTDTAPQAPAGTPPEKAGPPPEKK